MGNSNRKLMSHDIGFSRVSRLDLVSDCEIIVICDDSLQEEILFSLFSRLHFRFVSYVDGGLLFKLPPPGIYLTSMFRHRIQK